MAPPRRQARPAAMPSARDIAARVIARVLDGGAFIAACLDAELKRHPQLDPRDVGLATELSYGVVRSLPALEAIVADVADDDRWKKTAAIRAHLAIAVYTIVALDRIPAFAAVDEAVEASKRALGRRVGGFVNAVLRRIAANPPALTATELAEQSVSPWLAEALRSVLDDERDLSHCLVGPSVIGLCVAAGESRDRWVTRLMMDLPPDAEVRAGTVSPRAVILQRGGHPSRIEGENRAWWIQEEGAQLMGLLVDARPGERVLDACAGRGGKTRLLAEAVGDGGRVDAADLHAKKLVQLRRLLPHPALGATHAVDWAKGSGDFAGVHYDRILLDAPCSGTGTMRHRPEIARRLGPQDVERLARLQRALLTRLLGHLRPGGELLYVVCSLLPAEGEAVVEAALEEGDRYALAPLSTSDLTIEGLTRDAPWGRLTPARHGTDGFFAARIRHLPRV